MNIAILGGGINSAVGRAHISALRLQSDIELAWGYFSRDESTNRQSGSNYGFGENTIAPSYEQFIEEVRERADVAIVLTPTPAHFPQIKSLLETGVDVISEKALTTSADDAKKLHEISTRTNCKLAVTYNYTGFAMIRELHALIAQGTFGQVNCYDITMPSDGYVVVDEQGKPNVPQKWRQEDLTVPMVSLDLGVHVVNLAHFLGLGNVKQINSVQRSFGNFSDVVDTVMGFATIDDESLFNFSFGKAFLGSKNGLSVRILGTDASAEWVQENPDVINIAYRGGKLRTMRMGDNDLLEANKQRYNRFKAGHPTGFIEAFANYYEDVFSVFGKKPHAHEASSFVQLSDHAVRGLEFLETVARSHHVSRRG